MAAMAILNHKLRCVMALMMTNGTFDEECGRQRVRRLVTRRRSSAMVETTTATGLSMNLVSQECIGARCRWELAVVQGDGSVAVRPVLKECRSQRRHRRRPTDR